MQGEDNETEVVLIRSAETQWDAEGRFHGWGHPALTETGTAMAHTAGRRLRESGFSFHHVYTSRLLPARQTIAALCEELAQADLPVDADWRLNERHHGALQGSHKVTTARLLGREQFQRWERGYLDLPPPMHPSDPAHPVNDPLHADLPPTVLPSFESLDRTRERVLAFWNERILPHIADGERVLIGSHGDALRALIMGLGGVRVAEVEKLELPMATPIVYRLEHSGKILSCHCLDESADCAA